MIALTPDEILNLLRSPTPPPSNTGGGVGRRREFVHDLANNMPRSKHVQWLDDKRICNPGVCGSPAYIRIDGEPKCLKHAFDAIVIILNTIEEINE